MGKFTRRDNTKAREPGYRLQLPKSKDHPNGRVILVPQVLAHRNMKPLTKAGMARQEKRKRYAIGVEKGRRSGENW